MMLARTQLENWAVLAAVVDEGGFQHAADTLHKSQSAVSYAVARLQEQLGVRLLAIEGRKSVLTAHGIVLLGRARRLLADMHSLEALAQSLLTDWEADLRLVVDAAFPRALLVNILRELQHSCPATRVQLADAILSGGAEAIAAGTADVVITSRVPAGHLGEWLLDIDFIAVAQPEHPLFASARERGAALTTDDLTRHAQSVVRDSGHDAPRDEGWLGAELRYTVGSLEASVALVTGGLAFAWLPAGEIHDLLQADKLRELPLAAGGRRRMSLSIVLVHSDIAGRAARAAVDAFRRAVGGSS
ncbi:MAG: LysR family transcriptional regulator [Pseudomonadota bacterium]